MHFLHNNQYQHQLYVISFSKTNRLLKLHLNDQRFAGAQKKVRGSWFTSVLKDLRLAEEMNVCSKARWYGYKGMDEMGGPGFKMDSKRVTVVWGWVGWCWSVRDRSGIIKACLVVEYNSPRACLCSEDEIFVEGFLY